MAALDRRAAGRAAPLWLVWLFVHGLGSYVAVCAVVTGCYLWQRFGENLGWPFPLQRDTTVLPTVLAIAAALALTSGVPFLEARHRGLVAKRLATVVGYTIVGLSVLMLRPETDLSTAVIPPVRAFCIALGTALLLIGLLPTPLVWGILAVRALLGTQFIPGEAAPVSFLLWELAAPLGATPWLPTLLALVAGTVAYSVRGTGIPGERSAR